MKQATQRFAARLITRIATCAIVVTPRPLLAWTTRRWIAQAVRRGERKIARGGTLKRVLSSAVTPLSVLVLEIGGREIEIRLVPWLAWFRDSIYYRSLSRGQLLTISKHFSEKVSMRMLLPAGLSLPVGLTAGVAVEATGSLLEWLIDRLVL